MLPGHIGVAAQHYPFDSMLIIVNGVSHLLTIGDVDQKRTNRIGSIIQSYRIFRFRYFFRFHSKALFQITGFDTELKKWRRKQQGLLSPLFAQSEISDDKHPNPDRYRRPPPERLPPGRESPPHGAQNRSRIYSEAAPAGLLS